MHFHENPNGLEFSVHREPDGLVVSTGYEYVLDEWHVVTLTASEARKLRDYLLREYPVRNPLKRLAVWLLLRLLVAEDAFTWAIGGDSLLGRKLMRKRND